MHPRENQSRQGRVSFPSSLLEQVSILTPFSRLYGNCFGRSKCFLSVRLCFCLLLQVSGWNSNWWFVSFSFFFLRNPHWYPRLPQEFYVTFAFEGLCPFLLANLIFRFVSNVKPRSIRYACNLKRMCGEIRYYWKILWGRKRRKKWIEIKIN